MLEQVLKESEAENENERLLRRTDPTVKTMTIPLEANILTRIDADGRFLFRRFRQRTSEREVGWPLISIGRTRTINSTNCTRT